MDVSVSGLDLAWRISASTCAFPRLTFVAGTLGTAVAAGVATGAGSGAVTFAAGGSVAAGMAGGSSSVAGTVISGVAIGVACVCGYVCAYKQRYVLLRPSDESGRGSWNLSQSDRLTSTCLGRRDGGGASRHILRCGHGHLGRRDRRSL